MKKDLTNVTPGAAAETPEGSDAASEKIWPKGLLAMLVTIFFMVSGSGSRFGACSFFLSSPYLVKKAPRCRNRFNFFSSRFRQAGNLVAGAVFA